MNRTAILTAIGLLLAVVCTLAQNRVTNPPSSSPATIPASSSATASAPSVWREVYRSDFAKGAGSQWQGSDRKPGELPKTTAPNASTTFLGRFKNERVFCAISKMPEHKYVRVTFDLLLIHSWDGLGNGRDEGPDNFSVDVGSYGNGPGRNGPLLLFANFSNNVPPLVPTDQTFPNPAIDRTFPPVGGMVFHNKARTGAFKTDSLGYTWGSKPDGPPLPLDTTYRLTFCFAHQNHGLDGICITFGSESSPDIENESWGLDNVRIEVADEPEKLTDKQLEALWVDLTGNDPVKAFEAVAPLVGAGEQSLDFATAKLKDDPKGEIADLVKQLDADAYKVREAAQQKLQAMARTIDLILKANMEKTKSEEVKARIEAILADTNRPATATHWLARVAYLAGDSDKTRKLNEHVKSLQALLPKPAPQSVQRFTEW